MGPRDDLDVFRKEKFIPPTGIRTPDLAVPNLVSVHNMLPWLVTHHYVPRDKGEREMNVKLATHHHVVARLRMRGNLATPPYFFTKFCLSNTTTTIKI